jgi:MATE family multidrug resistance protein
VTHPRFPESVRRIGALAWPTYVGQVAVLAFGTVDTVLVARHSATDLAALAIGGAAYISVFIGLMGVILALGPIAGQLYGARRLAEAGHAVQQAVWLALALSVLGGALLLFPEPFLRLSQAPAEVEHRARGYLAAVACALPAALLFTAYRAFNIAVSRPKAVMALQVGALVLKVPLSAVLVFGLELPFGAHISAFGAPGAGVATAIVMIGQALAGAVVLRRDRWYAPYGLQGRFARPDRVALAGLLRLGVPMGLSMLVEVTGFAFMAFFISRLGAMPVAGHQIAVNLVSLMYMLPLAIANACGTLVAQRIGAGDPQGARRMGWHGVLLGMLCGGTIGLVVYALRGGIVALYTDDAVIAAAALPLLAWVALFHTADATQAVTAFVLRAYRIVNVPLVINAVAMWGVGLAGGYALAFVGGPVPVRGAQGFWSAATVGLVVAAVAQLALLAHAFDRQRAALRTAAA